MLFHDFPVTLIIIVPGFSMMVNAFDERQTDRQTNRKSNNGFKISFDNRTFQLIIRSLRLQLMTERI